MSADFWSFAVSLKPTVAAALERKLRAMETVDPVYDPKGSVLHRFTGKSAGGASANAASIGDVCGGKAPKEIGRAYVDASLDDLEPLLESTILMSSGYASVVVLDRALALPHGVDLMGGHAVRAIVP